MDANMHDTVLMALDIVLYGTLAIHAAVIVRYFLIRRDDLNDEL